MRRWLLPVVLFCASIAFAAVAVGMPNPPPAVNPYAQNGVCTLMTQSGRLNLASTCNAMEAIYNKELSVANFDSWLSSSLIEVGEGLAAVGMLVLLLPRLKVPRTPTFKSRLLVIGGIVSAASFFLFGFAVHIFFYFPSFLPGIQFREFIMNALDLSPFRLGLTSFLCFCVASLCLALRYSLKTTISKFVIPSIFALMVCLAVVDEPEMPIHVTLFLAPLAYRGVSLISNWFVLLVSAFLLVEGRFVSDA